MSTKKLDCYILPTLPKPLLLPVECVAEIVSQPVIDSLETAPAKWMEGHVNWRNQRLPVMSYAGLHNAKAVEQNEQQALLIVLNPIPGAARKAYSALLCHGEVQQISVEANLDFAELPNGMDKRYVESVIQIEEQEFVVPKLTAIAVAFTYF